MGRRQYITDTVLVITAWVVALALLSIAFIKLKLLVR